MVLIIGGELSKTIPTSTKTFYELHPAYRTTAKHFLAKGITNVESSGCLYVGQREYAVTVPEDNNVTVLGTDDVTTCIMVIIRHSGTGATALGHLDGVDVKHIIMNMVTRVQELSEGSPEGLLEFQIIGGYFSEKESNPLFGDIMSILHSCPVEVHLTLACVDEENTVNRNGVPFPIVYGAGVNMKTGEIFPAAFSDRGPDIEARSANLYSRGKGVEIYDCKKGILKIGPFAYKILPNIDILLAQDDQFLLMFSTSPQVEPPHFIPHVRSTLKFMKDNPHPYETVFKNGQPHYFKRNEDCNAWVRVHL